MLGVDVGYSPTRKTGCACRLTWDERAIAWSSGRFRYAEEERRSVLNGVIGSHFLLAAAFDGPLCGGLGVMRKYRPAEKMLTVGLGRFIGKPGQASTPGGIKLNEAANEAARAVLSLARVDAATHTVAIDQHAIAEAFPTSFLGVMLSDPGSVTTRRGNRSDKFFERLVQDGGLARLLQHFLPGRAIRDLGLVTNHDDRAGLICAMTALAVAANDYTAVGDEIHGWIVLPPWRFIAPWAQDGLLANAAGQLGQGLHRSSAPPKQA